MHARTWIRDDAMGPGLSPHRKAGLRRRPRAPTRGSRSIFGWMPRRPPFIDPRFRLGGTIAIRQAFKDDGN